MRWIEKITEAELRQFEESPGAVSPKDVARLCSTVRSQNETIRQGRNEYEMLRNEMDMPPSRGSYISDDLPDLYED